MRGYVSNEAASYIGLIALMLAPIIGVALAEYEIWVRSKLAMRRLPKKGEW